MTTQTADCLRLEKLKDGALWSVRSRLAEQVGDLPHSPTLAVTSGDGRLASLATRELAALRPDSDVFALAGGTQAWKSLDLPLEAGLTRPLGPTDDVQYKPYDHEGAVVEQHMRDYLTWEVALVDQIARDPTVSFRRYD